jgi:hypothetical protein
VRQAPETLDTASNDSRSEGMNHQAGQHTGGRGGVPTPPVESPRRLACHAGFVYRITHEVESATKTPLGEGGGSWADEPVDGFRKKKIMRLW